MSPVWTHLDMQDNTGVLKATEQRGSDRTSCIGGAATQIGSKVLKSHGFCGEIEQIKHFALNLHMLI